MDRSSKPPLRVYADTSVFGGCFDLPFIDGSRRFFRLVRKRRIVILISEVVERELSAAPGSVLRIFKSLPDRARRSVKITDDVLELRGAYLEAGVVGRRSVNDAEHVAAATVAGADAIVSWNFRDIVGPDKIRGYNEVNLRLGYGNLTIQNPGEVPDEED